VSSTPGYINKDGYSVCFQKVRLTLALSWRRPEIKKKRPYPKMNSVVVYIYSFETNKIVLEMVDRLGNGAACLHA